MKSLNQVNKQDTDILTVLIQVTYELTNRLKNKISYSRIYCLISSRGQISKVPIKSMERELRYLKSFIQYTNQLTDGITDKLNFYIPFESQIISGKNYQSFNNLST